MTRTNSKAARNEKPTATATASLHKDGRDDEPLEVDLDVAVTCDCGTTSTKRDQIYSEDDSVFVMCDGCGASWEVAIQTALVFTVSPKKILPSVLNPRDRAARKPPAAPLPAPAAAPRRSADRA